MALHIIRKPTPHIVSLRENMSEINRLLEIHKEITGEGPGRKYNVQVLNKSAIVLLLACWEAYIEDLAKNCFEHILSVAETPLVFPEFVLAIAAKEIKKADTPVLWGLSGIGWKNELSNHKSRILEKYIDRNSFNTPSAENIDRLFSELVGITSISNQWKWVGMTPEKSAQKLRDLIELRGSIAHRVQASDKVLKKTVTDYRAFLWRLAVITHNRARAFIYARTRTRIWRQHRYGATT